MEITRPEAWHITYVALVPQSIMVEAIFRRETYRFAIADTLLADVKEEDNPLDGSTSSLAKLFSDRVTLAVKLLGLPEKYIKSINRLETDFYAVPTTELSDPPSTCKTPKPEKPSSTQVTSSPRKSTPPTTPVVPITYLALSPISNRSLSPARPSSPPPAKNSKNISSSDSKRPEKPSSAPVTAITSKPSTPPTTPAVNTSIPALSPISTGSMPPLPPPAKKPKRSTIPYTPEKPSQPGPTYIPTPKQLLATITTQDIPNLELRTPAERATTLLRLGGMPLFPPARRDWTGRFR
ncbi:unnamed protein product [Mytilus edulis]|uniref:Uncharacterized protein n=1 Tax=Mytilus edulis TaxID=6550 RepID=A0A8S3TCE5_MYTED|nr:unnamed protein product [Mytilus edulis]